MEEEDSKGAFDFLQIDSHSLATRDDEERLSKWIKTQATCVFLLAMCNDMSHCKRKDGNEDLSKLLIQNVELRRRIIIMKTAEEGEEFFGILPKKADVPAAPTASPLPNSA